MTDLDNQLIDAVRNNNLEEAKDLLSKGADVDYHDCRPLWVSARYGRLLMAKLLIENGADVTDVALYRAKENGHTEMVEFLKNEQRNQNDQLLDAIRDNNLEEAKDLLSKGMDVNYHDCRPLWVSARYGRLSMAKLLIEKGAYISDVALYRAKENGNTEMVEFLNNERRNQND